MTGWRLALWFALRPKLWLPTLSMAMHIAFHIYQSALAKAVYPTFPSVPVIVRKPKSTQPPAPEAW